MKNYYVQPDTLKGKRVLIIPQGVTDIFNETEFDPNRVTNINTSVKIIIIPNTVERICRQAFACFTGLKCVFILGHKLVEIHESAFENCCKLSYINIPNSVSYIGEKAFSYTKIRKIPRLENCNYIGTCAFQNTSLKGVLNLSRTKVDIIFKGAFRGTNKLTKCILPNNLFGIETQAFAGSGIKSINLSDTADSIKFIGDYAFDCCTNLHVDLNFTQFKVLNTIGKAAFTHTRASNLKICHQDIKIGDFAFSHCYSLNNISFSGLEKLKIPNKCFFYTNIEKAFFGAIDQLYIGERCFNASSIGNIEFMGVKNIMLHKNAFKAVNISEFTIGNLTQALIIGEGCFSDCNFLRKVNLLSDKLRIHKNAFRNCGSLCEVNFSSAVSSCPSIGTAAFANCISLESIKLPDTVIYIKDDAFYNCDIVEIEFPEKLQVIGKRAFESNYIHKLNFEKLSDLTISNSAFLDNLLTPQEICFNYCSSPKIHWDAFADDFIFNFLSENYPFIQWFDD